MAHALLFTEYDAHAYKVSKLQEEYEIQSIALFPCSYTDEAGIIGELSNSLRLRVYTDEMLFSDVSEQFGVQIDKLKRILFSLSLELNRYKLKKEKYINLLKCTLEARRRLAPGGCIFYGLHTSLLDPETDRVLKVLVFDDEKGRVRRAMQQGRFNEATARDHISALLQKIFHSVQSPCFEGIKNKKTGGYYKIRMSK